jgi:CheY-like chemotaxis protein
MARAGPAQPTPVGDVLSQLIESVGQLLGSCLELEQRLERAATTVEGALLALPAVAMSLTEVRVSRGLAGQLRHGSEQLMLNLVQAIARGLTPVPDGERGRVLVVDDSHDACLLVEGILKRARLETITAANGLEALVVVHHARPCLVLMDISMPVLDGIAAARLLKADAATRDVPVIAYTASPEVCHAAAAEQLFAHVVTKPVVPAVLVDLVQRYAT